jgi:hypothetical protein
MAKKSCGIYGPDLSEHEREGAAIAEMGLACMKGIGSPEREEKSDGDEVSKNNLEKFKPSNP